MTLANRDATEMGLTKAGLDHTRDQLALLEQFVKDVLRKDEDYGVIPGTRGKPTLLKPGAANVTAAFNCHAEPAIDSEILDTDKPFVSYEAHVDLVSNLTGQVMARGFGNCNSHEVKYRYRYEGQGDQRHRIENLDALDQANTIKKMAIKRAEVDAAMRLPGVARFFTQDLEDMQPGNIQPTAKAQPNDNRYRCPDPEHGGAIWTKKTGKDGKSWYSHKQGNGWCNMADARLDAGDPGTQPQAPHAPDAPDAPESDISRQTRASFEAIVGALPVATNLGTLRTIGQRLGYRTIAEMGAVTGPSEAMATKDDLARAVAKLVENSPLKPQEVTP